MFHPKASNKCPSYRAAELLSVTKTLYPPENMSVPHKYLEAMKFPLRAPYREVLSLVFPRREQPRSLCAHTKETGHIWRYSMIRKKEASKAVNRREVFAAPGSL